MHGDIRAPEDLELPDIDVIVECSAEPSVLAGYTTAPSYVVNTNLGGTVNCLELARRCRADVVFLSTSRVYPIAPINQLAYHETDTRFVLDDVQALAGASGRGLTEAFTSKAPGRCTAQRSSVRSSYCGSTGRCTASARWSTGVACWLVRGRWARSTRG